MLPNFYPVFVLAVALLILTPGPNVALIVANSVAHGTRYGLLTVAGTVSANAVHLGFVGFGLGEAMGAIGHVFYWLKWAGVAYLVVLGLRTWRGPVADLGAVRAQGGQGRRMFARAVVVGLTNPKSLLFYAAFFPPFIAADRAIAPQVWTMCATYLAVAVVIDGLWALVAGRVRGVLRAHGRLRNRVSGGLLMGAGWAWRWPGRSRARRWCMGRCWCATVGWRSPGRGSAPGPERIETAWPACEA